MPEKQRTHSITNLFWTIQTNYLPLNTSSILKRPVSHFLVDCCLNWFLAIHLFPIHHTARVIRTSCRIPYVSGAHSCLLPRPAQDSRSRLTRREKKVSARDLHRQQTKATCWQKPATTKTCLVYLTDILLR